MEDVDKILTKSLVIEVKLEKHAEFNNKLITLALRTMA